jgi:hypothetical protein
MKKMSFLAVLLVCALLLGACAAAATPQAFKNDAGKFTVVAPVEMKESSQSVDTAVGKVDIYMFAGDGGNISYIIAYSDYPPAVANADVQSVLDGARNGAVSNSNGTLTGETKITLDGYPGREFTMDTKDSTGRDITAKARIYLVGVRLYQVLSMAVKGDALISNMDPFLNSFALLK